MTTGPTGAATAAATSASTAASTAPAASAPTAASTATAAARRAGPLRPLLRPLVRAFETFAIALLIGATTLIMIEVVARGLLNLGLPWAGELARYCGLGVIFLTVPLLLADGSHVRVDLFLNLLPRSARPLADALNEVLTLLFCALFLVSCYWFMQRAGRFSTPALGIPNLIYYLPAIAGMVLTALVALDRVLAVLRPGGTGGAPGRVSD